MSWYRKSTTCLAVAAAVLASGAALAADTIKIGMT